MSLGGLIAAVHTPLRPDGTLNPEQVDRQARHVAAAGVTGVGSWSSRCNTRRNEPTTGKARMQSTAMTQKPLGPKRAKSHPDTTVRTAVAPPTPTRP